MSGAPPAEGAVGGPSWPRRLEQLATVAALIWAAVVAGQDRLRLLDHLGVDRDYAWFLRVAEQLSHGQEWPGPLMYLYTRIPSWLFGLLAWALDGPSLAMQAWTLLCATVAPLTLLAVRAVGGLPAGILAAFILIEGSAQRWVGTGLKSPYMLPAILALLALGIAWATERRPWAPALMVLAATAAVGFHVGTGPAAVVTGLLAAVHVLRQPGWPRRLGAGALAVLAGLPLTWVVLGQDLPRLLADLEIFRDGGITDPVSLQTIRKRAMVGLAIHLSTLTDLLKLAGVGLGMAVAWRVLLPRLPSPLPRLRAALPAHTRAAAVTAQVALVAAAVAAPYLRNVETHAYGEVHHYVPLAPLLMIVVAGGAAALAPPAPRAVGWFVALLALLPWLQDHRQTPLARNKASEASLRIAAITDLAEDLRAHAPPGREIVLFGWSSLQDHNRDDMVLRTVNELVRLGRASTQGLPPTCFLASRTPPRFAAELDPVALRRDTAPWTGGRDSAGTPYTILHDPDCALLVAEKSRLCSPPPTVRLAWRMDYGAPLAEDELFGRNCR